jgi:hypothetical protein
MRTPLRSWSLVCAPLLGAGLAVLAPVGCSPSYRQDQVISTLQSICADEYKLHVTAKQVGQTLAVHLHHDGILQQQGNQVGLTDNAQEILGNLIEAIHRVVLSSDARINFYLVLVSDSTIPGAYLTILRYMEDVRRANANMLPPTEFFHRTIFDLKFVGGGTVGLDQFDVNDITLEEFLSWQLARRIHTHLTEELAKHGVNAEVGQCSGEFQNREFAFTVTVAPPAIGAQVPTEQSIDESLIQQVFQDTTSVIAQVLTDYQFNRFDSVRIVHMPTGRSLNLPRARLELFR